MSYTVGNLFLDIEALDNSVDKSIDNVISGLNKLYDTLTKFSNLDVSSSLGEVSSAFNFIQNSLNNFDIAGSEKLKNVFADILAFSSSLSNLNNINTTNFGEKVEGLFKRISGISSSLNPENFNTVSKSVQTLISSLNKLNTTQADIFGEKIEGLFKRLGGALDFVNAEKFKIIASSIQKLYSTLNKLNEVQTVLSGTKIEVLFTKISNATNSLNPEKLTIFASAAKSLSTLSHLSKLQDLDFAQIESGFARLTTAIKPFIEEVQRGEASLNSLYGALNIVSGKKVVQKQEQNASLDLYAQLNNLKTFFNGLSRFVKKIYSIAEYGSDYTETLNLWSVAMRDNLDLADEFINKMNKAYGISKKVLMDAQATFKNMLSTLGEIPEELAYKTSEAVTQMAVDFASLYNVEFEEAFTKFQAVLSGQVRPIRSVSGYDITEKTLEELYKRMGGEKSIRQLTQIEKRLLAISAIYDQMSRSGAVGDLQKTLDTFANRSKQLSEATAEAKTNLGLMLQQLLMSTNIMQYLIAGMRTFANLFEAIANKLGYSEEKQVNAWANAFDDTTDSINDTDEALTKLKGNFLDFDKFRVLDSTSKEDTQIDSVILNVISSYENLLNSVDDEFVDDLVEKWSKFFGVFEDANGELQITDGGLVSIVSQLTAIVGLVGSLAFGAIISNIAKIAKSLREVGGGLTTVEKGVKSLEKSGSGLASIGKAIGVVVVAIASFIASFNLVNAGLSQLDGVLKTVISSLAIVAGIVAFIFTITKVKNVLAAAALAAASLGAVIAGAANLVSSIEKHEMGASDIDGGTLFIAGEGGKTEAVYTGSNGKSNVANIAQLRQAFYGALVDWSASNKGETTLNVYLDGETVYKNTTKHANMQGKTWAKV